jgi:SAM-dependent methyltransferase
MKPWLRIGTLIACSTLALAWHSVSADLSRSSAGESMRLAQADAQPPRPLDVPFVATGQDVVAEMLRLGRVGKNDIVYDLGCGDGRIVISAAKTYGARGVGVDIDPERVREARDNAVKAGVGDKVTIRQQDLFETDLRDATVVTLYLLPEVNLKLRPKLLSELKPGTRVVSHNFDMGDWTPEQVVRVGNATVYLWTIPARETEDGAANQ